MRAARLPRLLPLLLLLPGLGQAPPDWETSIIEVTAIDRQDPPARLVERRLALEAALGGDESNEAATEAQRQQIDRLEARIEKETGWIVSGWGARLDRRGERIDSSIGMFGAFVPGGVRYARLFADLEPGAFLQMSRRGAREIISTGGRRYYRPRRIEAAEPPAWWSSPGRATSVPAPKNVTDTPGSRRIFRANAIPVARGIDPPTIADEP